MSAERAATDFSTGAYDYDLPPELIAQVPIEPRDAARLMVVDRATGAIGHRAFRDLPELLAPRDLLVANRSRVIPARLHGHKLPTGGAVEILLLRAVGDGRWESLVRPGKRVAVGTRIGFGGREVFAEIVDRTPAGGRVVRFVDGTGATIEGAPFDRWLAGVGDVPLPPYIHERLDAPERYQTVYAQEPGSVAAPTAGLHFTPELLFRLRDRGVGLVHVTLHVGLDTFRPVETDDLRDHAIHAEWCELSEPTAERIARARRSGGRVVAVGTTSVRVLESAATYGRPPDSDRVTDRDPSGTARDADGGPPGTDRDADGGRPGSGRDADGGRPGSDRDAEPELPRPYRGDTRLFIYPGFRFRAVDALITNFHLPRSSLLMLVSAFAGRELIARAYTEAIAERYRFFSFGDAMLIR